MTTKKNDVARTDAPAAGSNLPATAAAPANLHVEGLDEIQPNQIQVPLLIHVQPTSKGVGEARPGDWLLRSSGKVFGQKVRFVPIAMFNTRACFEKDNPVPICTSLDGKVPERGSSPASPTGAVAHRCADCHFAQRQADPKNPRSRLPAPCAEAINFLGMVWGVEDEEIDGKLCQVRFKRTSWAVGRSIISTAQMGATRIKTLWGRCYELYTAKIEESTLGKYAVPGVKEVDPTAKQFPSVDGEARGYSQIWSQIRERVARASVAPDEEAAEEATVADVQSVSTAPAGGDAPPNDDLPF